MKILTFTGKSPSEALKKAKLEIGDEGMLIETREIRKKSLTREGLYEIVIGIDESALKESYPKPRKPLSSQQPLKKRVKIFSLTSQTPRSRFHRYLK